MDDASPSPHLIVLFGPPAVGKMTVGQELERLTGFRLFHIHQISDLVNQYFPYSSAQDSSYLRLVVAYRRLFFEEAARSGLNVSTTAGWRFNLPTEEPAIRSYIEPFLRCGGRVSFVELSAPLETRLERNRTENRRRHKRTDWATDDYLRQDAAQHRYDSGGVLPLALLYKSGSAPSLSLPLLRLDTEHLSAAETATRIREHFGLPNLSAFG